MGSVSWEQVRTSGESLPEKSTGWKQESEKSERRIPINGLSWPDPDSTKKAGTFEKPPKGRDTGYAL
jgi:hypothetical protein